MWALNRGEDISAYFYINMRQMINKQGPGGGDYSRDEWLCDESVDRRSRAVYPERNDSSIMTLSILMRWVVTQTNRMIPSMTRYAATTRSRRCPRESEPLACLKFETKQRVIFPLATVAMAY